MPQQKVEDLYASRLCSGDRPSIVSAGTAVAYAVKAGGRAVFMVDALDRVVLMAPDSVQVLKAPLIGDDELDTFEEDMAILIMTRENRKEEDILAYFKRRKERGIKNAS